MKRYENVLETKKDIDFEVSERTNGESESYANPPIPEGYKHICGEWEKGFVIERCSDRSQFVWIPVEILDSNGTLDGISFSEKFGRRKYRNEFSRRKFHESLDKEFALQIGSVKKYGGFYISRYNISKSSAGKPESTKGAMPWVNINFYDAKEIASSIENNEAVKSHLTFGAEYDSVLEWFIQSKTRTRSEISEDSTNWGNHRNTKNSPGRIVKTGSCEDWCSNNIYDFTGNVNEWTQEQDNNLYYVIRGGTYDDNGYNYPAACRSSLFPNYSDDGIGFRATLYIK